CPPRNTDLLSLGPLSGLPGTNVDFQSIRMVFRQVCLVSHNQTPGWVDTEVEFLTVKRGPLEVKRFRLCLVVANDRIAVDSLFGHCHPPPDVGSPFSVHSQPNPRHPFRLDAERFGPGLSVESQVINVVFLSGSQVDLLPNPAERLVHAGSKGK